MNAITADALERCRAGFSPSDATVLATMGRAITPQAIARIEMIVEADRRRRDRETDSRCAVLTFHGIEVVPDETQTRIEGSVFRYVAEAHEQAKMRNGGHGIDRVHLHPDDVERLFAEAP